MVAPVLFCTCLLLAPVANETAADTPSPAAAEREPTTGETNANDPPVGELPRDAESNRDERFRQRSAPAPRLPPAIRARLMMLLVLIAVLGALLILFVVVAGQFTRRYMHQGDRQRGLPRQTIDEDDWAKKPLIPRDGIDDDVDVS